MISLNDNLHLPWPRRGSCVLLCIWQRKFCNKILDKYWKSSQLPETQLASTGLTSVKMHGTWPLREGVWSSITVLVCKSNYFQLVKSKMLITFALVVRCWKKANSYTVFMPQGRNLAHYIPRIFLPPRGVAEGGTRNSRDVKAFLPCGIQNFIARNSDSRFVHNLFTNQ